MHRLFTYKGVIGLDLYKTIKMESSDEFVERRSRFIGYAKPVETEEEAVSFINSKREKHRDATHNVYAYILRDRQIMRYSDDGEPQGTAGIPVLDVLKKNELTDLVVVVTRYFGGTLLGAGGLVRAYSHGASIAINAAGIISMKLCAELKLTCDYSGYGKISSLIASFNGKLIKEEFLDLVTLDFYILKKDVGLFNKELSEVSSGKVVAENLREKFAEM